MSPRAAASCAGGTLPGTSATRAPGARPTTTPDSKSQTTGTPSNGMATMANAVSKQPSTMARSGRRVRSTTAPPSGTEIKLTQMAERGAPRLEEPRSEAHHHDDAHVEQRPGGTSGEGQGPSAR